MIQLQQVKLMNESMILYLKKLGKSSKRNEIISKILKDDTCFFKINKNDAYIILEDIGISKEKIESIYSELTSSDNYYYLQKIGKIKDEDKEIIVKYKNYDYNDLFKNKNKKYDLYETIRNSDVSMIKYKENKIQKIINKIKEFFKI